MIKEHSLNRLATHSNNIGVAIFWLGSLTNETDLDIALSNNQTAINKPRTVISLNDLADDRNSLFSEIPDKNLSLISKAGDFDRNESEVIMKFASHLLTSTRDIEPEIAKIVQDKFWEMI